jgi:hypothetical protein
LIGCNTNGPPDAAPARRFRAFGKKAAALRLRFVDSLRAIP